MAKATNRPLNHPFFLLLKIKKLESVSPLFASTDDVFYMLDGCVQELAPLIVALVCVLYSDMCVGGLGWECGGVRTFMSRPGHFMIRIIKEKNKNIKYYKINRIK